MAACYGDIYCTFYLLQIILLCLHSVPLPICRHGCMWTHFLEKSRLPACSAMCVNISLCLLFNVKLKKIKLVIMYFPLLSSFERLPGIQMFSGNAFICMRFFKIRHLIYESMLWCYFPTVMMFFSAFSNFRNWLLYRIVWNTTDKLLLPSLYCLLEETAEGE